MEYEIKQETPLDIDGLHVAGPSEYRNSNVNRNSFVHAINETSCSKKRRLQNDVDSTCYQLNGTDASSEEMLSLLQQWGLEALSERFTANLIDVSVLDYIVDVDIVDLCRDLPMRYRLVLRHKLRQKCYHRFSEPIQTQTRSADPADVQVTHAAPVPAASYQKSMRLIDTPVPKSPITSETRAVEPANFDWRYNTPFYEFRSGYRNNPLEVLEVSLEGNRRTNPAIAEDDQCEESLHYHDINAQVRSARDETRFLEQLYQSQRYEEPPNAGDEHLVNILNQKVAHLESKCITLGKKWELINERNENHDIPLTFTEYDGYISAERLKKFSDETSSDYTFVKLIMDELWPEGFSDRTVTGRPSNNVSGCKGKAVPSPQMLMPKIPLEKEKVDYIRDRLLERRLILGDSKINAMHETKQTNKLMGRVIANFNSKSRHHSDASSKTSTYAPNTDDK